MKDNYDITQIELNEKLRKQREKTTDIIVEKDPGIKVTTIKIPAEAQEIVKKSVTPVKTPLKEVPRRKVSIAKVTIITVITTIVIITGVKVAPKVIERIQYENDYSTAFQLGKEEFKSELESKGIKVTYRSTGEVGDVDTIIEFTQGKGIELTPENIYYALASWSKEDVEAIVRGYGYADLNDYFKKNGYVDTKTGEASEEVFKNIVKNDIVEDYRENKMGENHGQGM